MKTNTNKQIAELKKQIKELREDNTAYIEIGARKTQKIQDLTDIIVAMFKALSKRNR